MCTEKIELVASFSSGVAGAGQLQRRPTRRAVRLPRTCTIEADLSQPDCAREAIEKTLEHSALSTRGNTTGMFLPATGSSRVTTRPTNL